MIVRKLTEVRSIRPTFIKLVNWYVLMCTPHAWPYSEYFAKRNTIVGPTRPILSQRFHTARAKLRITAVFLKGEARLRRLNDPRHRHMAC
jgi:hypothetical protein